MCFGSASVTKIKSVYISVSVSLFIIEKNKVILLDAIVFALGLIKRARRIAAMIKKSRRVSINDTMKHRREHLYDANIRNRKGLSISSK